MIVKRHSQLAFAVVRYSFSILLIAGIIPFHAAAQIWSEDFNTYPNATTQAPPKWTTTATDCDDPTPNQGPGQSQWGVWAGVFTCNDIEGAPCCPTFGGGGNDNSWVSEIIDISSYCQVSISLEVSASGVFECQFGAPSFGCMNDVTDNGHDQIVLEYNINSGSWTQFGYICGDMGVGTITATGLNGNTLQIRFFVANKSNAEYYYIDNIVVNGTLATTPTFNPIGPLCENAAPVALPTSSTQGINGTWNPTTINPSGQGGNSISATFTPNPGQCALPTTIMVSITSATTPSPNPIGPFCTTDPSTILLTNINGINGTWMGTGVSSNMFNPMAAGPGSFNLTFTPNPGQCANMASLPVTVTQAATPNLGTATICETDPTYNLNQLQDPMYPAGTWSGPGVSGSNFNPTGLNGVINLTYTSSANCVSPANTTITVNQAVTPVISGVPASICETEAAIALPTPQGGFTGNWSGNGVSGNNFDPTGQSGNVTLTFTPDPGQCANPATTSINVTPATTPAITGVPASVCENSAAIPLPTPQGGFTGNWSGNGVSGNNFDPTGQSGNVTLTFTPDPGQCANSATTSINVTLATTPAITGVPASICETEAAIALPTPQGGFTGNWSGNGVSGNNFNPMGLSGSVTLTFTPDPGQCANPATTSINVTLATTPAITGTPASVCENSAAIPLPTPQGGFTGNWSGNGVSGNNFDPTGQSGNVTLTFTPDPGQCANPATTSINITMPVTPIIAGVPAAACENESAIPLPTSQSGILGNWSGNGVSGNSFDPTGLSGSVILTFTPNPGQCADPATTNIVITMPVTPVITGIPASVCESAPPVALPTPQGGVAGNWTGVGVNNNSFDPTGLSGNVTLIFTPSAGQCANPTTTNILVNTPAVPVLGSDMICQNNGLYDLTNLVDPNYPNGSWVGPGVNGNNFNPTGQNGAVTLTFVPTANCTVPGTTTITVNSSVNFTNLMKVCDLNTQTYTVSFTITGDTPPYTVNGIPLAGSNFTSSPIPSGISYNFNIDDANGCGPVTVTGSQNCNCMTDAGSMNLTNAPLMLCYLHAQFSVPFNQDEVLDNDDLLQFVVHTGPNVTTSTIISTNNSPVIPTPPGLVLGQTYYVSAVAGNDDGTGNVDFNEPCFSYSQAIPIVFYSPTIQIGNDATICANDCYNLPVQFTGVAPFYVEWNIYYNNVLVGNSSSSNLPANSSIQFCPADFNLTSGVVRLEITALEDGNSCGVSLSSPTVNLTIGNGVVNNLSPTLCPGESVVVNGTTYNEANPTGTEFFPGGSMSGCDSTVNVNLAFYPSVSFTLAQSFCGSGSVTVNGTVYDQNNPSGTEILQNASVNGCDSTVYISLTFNQPSVVNISETLCTGSSLTVNGTVYDESNPSGTEVIPAGSANGCDSTINVSLSFNSVVMSNISPTLCPNGSITVNGTVYNAANPMGTETMPGASYLGCDSVAMVNLQFYPPAMGDFTQTLCTGGSLNIGGTVFDENNPTGTVIFPNASVNGCDSMLNVSITFNSVVTSNISPTLCPNGSITVNGTVYNAANPMGTETMPGASYLGCDSVAMVNLQFYPPAMGDFTQTLCTGGSLNIGGTVFDENNPTGTVIFPNASVNGCDSTLNVSISFNALVTSNINPTLCPEGSITVNGTVYNAANPMGTETMPGASYLGCDSVAMVSLSFYPAALGSFTHTACQGSSFNIGGTVFDENNPTGTVIFPNASVNGCDSMLNVSITFNSVVTSNINPTLCLNGSITVNGTVYNAANPMGTETMPGASYLGCDSVAMVSLSFYPAVVGSFAQTVCQGISINIGGTVFDENNPSGTVIFPNASVNGCDSTLTVSLQFYPAAQGSFVTTVCAGESVTVGNTVFDQNNPSGNVILPDASMNGCDSIVAVSLSFFPVASNLIDDQLCTNGSISVNGTVYDASNPSGTEVLQNASINGCDSTVFISLSFGSSVIVNLDPILCPGEVAVVNGQIYSASNPTGMETFPNGSYLGCDSIVNIDLSFYPDAIGNITEILQAGGSILVNGTLYNEQNPSGIEVFTGGSYTGCDSTVIVNLVFEGADLVGIVEVNSPLCHFGNDGVITLTGIQGGTPPYVVALNGGSSAPAVNFPVVFDNLSFGFHTLTIIDALGVIATQEIFMPDAPVLQLSMDGPFTVPLGNSVTLGASSASQITSWTWSPPDYLDCTNCPTPISTPLDDIVYTIAVTDVNGCTAEGELAVIVEKVVEVYVPNAFSPNNDGVNDELTIFAGPQVEKIKSFQIYSRWGEKVFELYNFNPNDLQLGWNGTFKEKELDPAVFVWYAEIVFKDGQVHLFKGGVTLIR
ncbi:MAG: T9SS type B sorting domain-containing protein [Bacteroidetes bacterium]|nr:T9SS type B sorting domain-containing protein [Bacteroidota bacterium]